MLQYYLLKYSKLLLLVSHIIVYLKINLCLTLQILRHICNVFRTYYVFVNLLKITSLLSPEIGHTGHAHRIYYVQATIKNTKQRQRTVNTAKKQK